MTSSYSNFRYIGTRWIIFLSNFGDQSLIITDDPSVGIKNIFFLALLDLWIVGLFEEDFVRLEQRFLPLGAQLVGTLERVDLEVEGTPGWRHLALHLAPGFTGGGDTWLGRAGARRGGGTGSKTGGIPPSRILRHSHHSHLSSQNTGPSTLDSVETSPLCNSYILNVCGCVGG